jgi:hypothetical protein
LHSSAAVHSTFWRDREEAYRVPAAPLTSSLQDPRALRRRLAAIVPVAAIILCRLRKLVCSVSCCGAVKARDAAGQQSCGNLHSDH